MARQAVLELLADASKLKKTLKDSEADAESFGSKVGGHMSSIGDSIAGMAKTAAVVGIPALVGFGVAAVKAFSESEKVGAQTEAVLKSTGGAAKITEGQVGDLAGKLSMLSGVDDELIQSGENVLLTFTNIKNGVGKNNDIFNQATKSALDMSVALGEDLQTANIQLGKALNDPVKGVSALQKVGVSFTESQKEQIKTLVASGHTMDAQKIILKELQGEFGGSAKAAGDTFAGGLNKLKVIAGNFMESVGGKLVPILLHLGEILSTVLPGALHAVSPIFESLKTGVQYLIMAFQDPGAPWEEGGPFLLGMAKVGQVIRQVVDTVSTAWGALMESLQGAGTNTNNNPIIRFAGQSGDAINRFLPVLHTIATTAAEVFTAVTGWVSDNRDKIVAVLAEIQGTFASAFGAIQAVVVAAINFLKGVWRVFGDDIISFAREAWASIGEIFRGAFNTISGIFDLIKAVFTGKWGDAWDALKKIVSGAWDTIFGVIRFAVTDVIPTILAGLGQVVSSVARAAFDGLKEAFKAALNWIIDRWNGLEFKIPGLDAGPLHLGGFTLGVPDVPRLAKGGITTGPTLALIGDNPGGRELVAPLPGAGGVAPTTINIYVDGSILTDGRALGDLVHSALLDKQSRSGSLAFT